MIKAVQQVAEINDKAGELVIHGVNLSLVTFAHEQGSPLGAVLVFLIFVVAAAEMPRWPAISPGVTVRPRFSLTMR